MKLEINGEIHEVNASTLAELLSEMDFGTVPVATAHNGAFIRAPDRAKTVLLPQDRIEILVPRQGG